MITKLPKVDFKKSGGLVPAVVQDASTRQVLMLGYMNEEALAKTLAEGRVTFYSRSKERLWTKGESSGHFLELVDVQLDCDADTLLLQANSATFGQADKAFQSNARVMQLVLRVVF